MGKIIRYFKVIYPNGKEKIYNDISRQQFCQLIENDCDNLCVNGCGRIALHGKEFDRHPNRYHYYDEEINGIQYKVLDIKDKWCRGCQIHESSCANLDYGRQFIDYKARNAKYVNNYASETGYAGIANANYTQIINKYDDGTKLYFYYANIDEKDDVYKIGTCLNPDTRLHKSRTKFYHDKYTLKDIHIIKQDDYKLIAALEYNAKIKYGIRGYELGNEFIKKEDLNKVLELSN